MVSYEAIKTEFEEIGRKVAQIIGLRDVMISTNSKAHIDDITKLFDVNTTVPTEVDIEDGGQITITLKMPLNIEKILIIADEDTGWENISFTATYDDGSQDTGSLTNISGVGSKVGLDNSKKLYKLVLSNSSGTAYTFNVREMIFYFSYLYLAELTGGDYELGAVEIKDADSDVRAKVDSDNALRVGAYDTSGTRIDPANLEVEQEIRDQLSLPNEDVNIQTSPAASTDYSAEIDVGRGDKVVVSLYSDQVPSSVKVEGSNDNTNFYEMDGISVDTSSWNTSKYNIYEFEPYTRYVKITLTTPSTAPTRVELYAKGVRT